MVKIDDILNTIDNNQNLSSEIKENIKDLMIIYASNNKNIDFETLNFNLANLKMEVASKYLVKEPLKYIDADKTIYINQVEMEKDYDCRFLLMRELMLMQTYKKDIGKLRQEHLSPLYEGYASICANVFVGNDSPHNPYEDEMITVNLLSRIVGYESINVLFNDNNSDLLTNNLIKSGNTIEDIKSLVDIMNYNTLAKDNDRSKSMLAEIQLKLIKMFANKDNKTAEEIEKFQSLLYGSNEVFQNNPNRYKDLKQTYETYNVLISNVSSIQAMPSKTR